MSADVGRRDVLRFGLGAGGALLVQVALPGCRPARFAVEPHAGDFVPNAWIRVSPDDRISFVLDRVEMGQGTMTAHAQLVAEELEVDPSRLVVELAPADRAYDNPDSQLGFQVTGGSTSTNTSYDPLRTAAATAREMLKTAAAKRWGVPVGACIAENGSISHPPSQRSARYGELAREAAAQSVDTPALKPASAFKWIGKSVPRLDAPSKVDGSAIYGIDVRLPGLHTAVIVRAPRLGAKVTSFGATLARQQQGVTDVLEVPNGIAVVATSYWRAQRAAALVKVSWTDGSTSLDSTLLRAAMRTRLDREGHTMRSDGDVGAAERASAGVLEAVYETPYLAHATLEPQNATAIVKDGRCEVWAPTQSLGLAREGLRRLTGYSYDDIVLHQTLLGGGYGRRLAQDYIMEAATIALRTGKPIKVMWSREDDTTHDYYRPMSAHRLRAAFARDGTITSWWHRVAAQSILGQIAEEWGQSLLPNRLPLSFKRVGAKAAATAYAGNAIPDTSAVEGARELPYAIPNVAVEFAPVNVTVPVGWWRSIGHSNNAFAVEAFFDEVARAARKDPFELRRALLARSPRHRAVLDLAAEKVCWGDTPRGGIFRGIAQTQAFGTYIAMVAEVSVKGSELRVHRVVAAVDCGRVVNPDLVTMQVEGGIGFGLGAALHQEITLRHGAIEQTNFHEFRSLRMVEMPKVEVHIVPSDEHPTGIGEPGVPLVAPAVANAILKATGQPVRSMPLLKALRERK